MNKILIEQIMDNLSLWTKRQLKCQSILEKIISLKPRNYTQGISTLATR